MAGKLRGSVRGICACEDAAGTDDGQNEYGIFDL